MPNQSTPIGFSSELPMCVQESVQVPGAKPWLVATGNELLLQARPSRRRP